MDVDALLAPLSSEAPCGPNFLAADAGLNRIDWEVFTVKAGGEKKDGIVQPPRWKDVMKEGMAMAARWRHLELGVILTEAAFELEGFGGLRDGLKVLHGWCTNYWDTVHPNGSNPDEDDEIIYSRPPILSALGTRPFVARLVRIPLARSMGDSYSLGDYQAARDVDKSDSEAANQARLVIGAFESTPLEDHQQNHAAAAEAIELARGIEDIFEAHFGRGRGLDLVNLRHLLSEVGEVLARFVTAPAENADTDEAPSAGGFPGSASSPAAARRDGGQALPGPGAGIASRQTAIAALESVVRYFEREEPSSPVPYLLRRAQRCIGKSYMELMDELGLDKAHAYVVLKPAENDASADQSSEYS